MSKRSVIQTNDGYLMLLDAVYFNGRRMGNISEEGLDWGGEDAQTVELWAAQIRTSPVLDIETRAATNEITGKMIEMVPQNCVDLMGGKVAGEEWQMPASSMRVEGDMRILTGTGKTVKLKRVSLRASKIRGGLGRRKRPRHRIRTEGPGPAGRLFARFDSADGALHRGRPDVADLRTGRRQPPGRYRSIGSVLGRCCARRLLGGSHKRTRHGDRRSQFHGIAPLRTTGIHPGVRS